MTVVTDQDIRDIQDARDDLENAAEAADENAVSESEELLKLLGSIRAGDMVAFEQLSRKYRPLLVSTVNGTMNVSSAWLSESDRDDLMQEALLALYKAACSYNENNNVRFGLYAKLCIRNGVINAAKKLSRQNVSIAEIEPVFEDTVDTDATPEEYLIANEKAEEIQALIEKELTSYERRVFLLHLAQHTYAEIADIVGKDIKSVANAITRVRAKLRIML